ncbi:DUF2750 domain-containing protein [Streptomyces adustus]|uniref:DUF2750 domain-containing protein n=1 Tax=Streptomyces adustus TaxID=1609272 RepID=UPI00371B3042
MVPRNGVDPWLTNTQDCTVAFPVGVSSADGTRSLPFWSTAARAQRAAKIWGHRLRVDSMPLDTWRDHDLPDATREGYKIGINWSGPRLVGWSFTPMEVLNRLAAAE